MKDNYNREINYLRISVTDLCNLRCKYCMPFEEEDKKEQNNILSAEEIIKVIKTAVEIGIKKVRITGGEPLLMPGIADLCNEIVSIQGIERVSITTNGILLEQLAEALKKAGVNQINISLDSLKPEKYKKITKLGNLADVLKGIDKVLSLGFSKVKVNVVLMLGINDDEIDAFISLADRKGIEVRFIELMPIGESRKIYEDRYVSSEIVLKQHPELILIEDTDGVADIYQIPGSRGKIGLIHPISKSFCTNCNRIRLTSDGKLKPCLYSDQEICLKDLNEVEIKKGILKAISEKPKDMKASLENKKQVKRKMNEIGG